MNDDETDESNAKGKEADNNSKEDKKPVENSEGVNALDRAEAANKETARLQEEKSKLLDREEKLVAIQQVGGHTVAGQEDKDKDLSPEKKKANQAEEFFKDTALGDAIKKTNE